jgi:hypothetical protein
VVEMKSWSVWIEKRGSVQYFSHRLTFQAKLDVALDEPVNIKK